MSFLAFDSLGAVLIFAIILVAIQFLFGNIIEPNLLGNNVEINFVTIIFSLVFWSSFMGIIGMQLAVPLTVLLKFILSEIPEASIIVKLMSTRKEIKEEATG